MNFKEILCIISKQYRKLLKGNLIGIYIHGSIAFNCFNEDKSDIDFIVVVKDKISQHTKLQLLEVLENLRCQAPLKGFEMSVVLKKYCQNFEYPTPYELHFSNACLKQYLENPLLLCNDDIKTDFDMAAHFTVIKNVGIVLYGCPITELFGDVPKENFRDSIFRDILNAEDDISEQPVYIILNLCRVYAYVRDELILSKKQGGEWGLKRLPSQFNGLITNVLDSYTSNTPLETDIDIQIEFCGIMLKKIFDYDTNYF